MTRIAVMPVNPHDFVTRFKHKWEHEFGNTSNPHLEDAWLRMCQAFNNNITNPESWVVTQLPTGSGKTEGLKVYLELLPEQYRVLVVTRFIEEAERLKSEIDRDDVDAVHSQSDSFDTVTPTILIVTHQAFLRHNEKLTEGRNLVVVDEVLDTTHDVRVSESDILKLMALLTELGLISHVNELEAFRNSLKSFDFSSVKNKKLLISSLEAVIGQPLPFKTETILDSLEKTMIKLSQKEAVAEAKETLISLEYLIYDSTKLYLMENNQNVSLVAPKKLYSADRGCVILDATAGVDISHQLIESEIIKPNKHPRNYQNLAIHTLRMSTGRGHLAQHMVHLLEQMCHPELKGEKILIVTTKNNKPTVELYLENLNLRNPFIMADKTVEVVHWGDTDGKNTWQDFDTLYILGLNHKHDTYYHNRLLNSDLIVSDESWFQDESNYRQLGFHNIVESYKDHLFATELIQLINRIRARRPIDSEGNCKPTQVFMTVHNQTILDLILGELPCVQLKEWSIEKPRTKQRRTRKRNYSKHQERFIEILRGINPGQSLSRQELMSLVGISSNTMDRLVKRLRDNDSEDELVIALKNLGITYEQQGNQSFFTKMDTPKISL